MQSLRVYKRLLYKHYKKSKLFQTFDWYRLFNYAVLLDISEYYSITRYNNITK